MTRASFLLALTVIGVSSAAGVVGCGLGDPADGQAGKPTVPVGDPNGGTGDIDGANDPSLSPGSHCIAPACEDTPLPPSAHVLRLTKLQWERTMRDLLRLPAEPGLSVNFPVDPSLAAAQFGTEASQIVVLSDHAKAFEKAAEDLADLLIANNGTLLDAILPAAAKSGDTATRVQAFVTDFLPRAYRRPVTAAEIAAAVQLGEDVVQSDATSDPFLLRARWILSGVLQSPELLYRIDLGIGAVKYGRVRLTDYEIATKLAYTLWGTMPDDTIIGYVKAGRLATRDGVADVAKEMLASPKANDALAEFHEQLLFAWNYASAKWTSLPKYYPDFTADVKEDVRLTIKDVIIDHNGGVKDLYTSSTAYVSPALASLYDIDGSTMAPGFTKITMDPTKRAGILMHPGWLAYEGTPKDPSLIRRGVYIARHLMCLPLGSPPAAAAGANPDKSAQPTNRKRVDETTKGCGDGCHGGASGIINPLGAAFENFDSLGVFRTTEKYTPMGGTEQTYPIDSASTLAELGAFDNAVDLIKKASVDANAHACYAAHWMAYLNGTTQINAHTKLLSPTVGKSLEGASVRDIIVSLVRSDAFLTVSR